MKREYLYNKLLKKGATPEEANLLLDLDQKFNLSSLKRKWRKKNPKEVKNMAKAEETRKKYSAHETAEQIKRSKDPNLQML